MATKGELDVIKKVWKDMNGTGTMEIRDAAGNVLGDVVFRKRVPVIKEGVIDAYDQNISRAGDRSAPPCACCGK